MATSPENNELSKKIIKLFFRSVKFLPNRSLKLISYFENKLLPTDNKDDLKKNTLKMNSCDLSIQSYIGLEQKNNPLISIILPIYNSNKNYLEKSIKSCLNQTYKNIELIIVEDGSEKDSEELVKSFSDDRIRYIKKQKNEKLPMALNTGFNASKGQYLTWTSDDNIYMEEALEIMYNFLKENSLYEFVYCDWYSIDENENIKGIKVNPLLDCILIENPIGPCFLYNRRVYETIGDFSTKYYGVEDYEYWIRVSKLFKMYPLRKVLYFYRFHNISITGTNHELVLLNQEKMIQQYLVK